MSSCGTSIPHTWNFLLANAITFVFIVIDGSVYFSCGAELDGGSPGSVAAGWAVVLRGQGQGGERKAIRQVSIGRVQDYPTLLSILPKQ